MNPLTRTVVIGNSGSGKSWLAGRLAASLQTEPVDLDTIHWEPGGFAAARDRQATISMVRAVAAKPAWVIEGIYGWLVRETLLRASALIWLDLPVEACLAALRERGIRAGEDAASIAELLTWAGDYPHRQTSSSLIGHGRIFDAFAGTKLRLTSRGEVVDMVAAIGSA